MFSMDVINNVEGAISELIRCRRTVYADRYTGEKIPKAIIEEMLKNATWAPTHKMTEPWRFIVLTGQKLKEYGEFMCAYYEDTYAGLSEQKKAEKLDYLKNYPIKASCMIAVICQFSKGPLIPAWEEIAAISCGVQNMALTCTAYGFGSYWATGGSAIDFVNEQGLEENEKSLGLFFIGKAAKKDMNVSKRRTSIEDKVLWIGT